MSQCFGKTNPTTQRYFNPHRKIHYFSATDADPYTYLGYWRRRFATDTAYMNYFYQYPDKCHNFRAPGYMKGGLNPGWVCPIMYTTKKCHPYNEGYANLVEGCGH